MPRGPWVRPRQDDQTHAPHDEPRDFEVGTGLAGPADIDCFGRSAEAKKGSGACRLQI